MGLADYQRRLEEAHAEEEERQHSELLASRERYYLEKAEFEALTLHRVVDRPAWTGLMRETQGRVIGGSIWTGTGYLDRGEIIATHGLPVPEEEREKDRARIQSQLNALNLAMKGIPR